MYNYLAFRLLKMNTSLVLGIQDTDHIAIFRRKRHNWTLIFDFCKQALLVPISTFFNKHHCPRDWLSHIENLPKSGQQINQMSR